VQEQKRLETPYLCEDIDHDRQNIVILEQARRPTT